MADIKNALRPPTICDNCQSSKVLLKENKTSRSKWQWCYECESCQAVVGCHPNTFLPLGLLADAQTRRFRQDAHKAFDPLWRSGLMTRTGAYLWLAEQLQIPFEKCHISWFKHNQLKTTIRLSVVYFEQNQHIAERRKEKRNATKARQRAFEYSKLKLRKANR